MKISFKCGMFILHPESKYHKLRKKNSDEEALYDVVYLGKFASPDEYEDVSMVDEYEARFDEQDALIIELATQMAILNLTIQEGGRT